MRDEAESSETGLSDEFRINSRGLPETHAALDRAAAIASVGQAKRTWGRRPGKAPVINLLVLWFDRLPRDVKAQILDEGMRDLVAIIEGKDVGPSRIPTPGLATPGKELPSSGRNVKSPRSDEPKGAGKRRSG